MNPETKKRIMELHFKGLSVYYIEKELNIHSWEAQEIIEEEEEEAKEQFNSLFRGG